MKTLHPTANPNKNKRDGSQSSLKAKNPSIFVLLNIPPKPSPIANITPVTKPITISTLSFFSIIRRTKSKQRERAKKMFAQMSKLKDFITESP